MQLENSLKKFVDSQIEVRRPTLSFSYMKYQLEHNNIKWENDFVFYTCHTFSQMADYLNFSKAQLLTAQPYTVFPLNSWNGIFPHEHMTQHGTFRTQSDDGSVYSSNNQFYFTPRNLQYR